METYFLDYYHPFAGLCNQLYLITNHIHDCYNKNVRLYINKINIDIFKKERVPVDQVLDIPKTNEKLQELIGVKILASFPPKIIETIPKLCIYPVSSIEILNCLEFNESILKIVDNLKKEFLNGYNAIHFRLDVDAIIHYVFGKEVYSTFMDLGDKNGFFEKLNQNKIDCYCSFLMKQYFNFILQFGFDKPWYISTSITKWDVHNPMLRWLQLLTNFIISNGGFYYIPHRVYNQRELCALVDLIMLRDSVKLIGFEGSSFSEGYCFKVNMIRNPGKEYLFVKEYP